MALDEADRLWVAYSRSSGVQEGQTYRFQDEGQEYNYHFRGPTGDEVWVATVREGRWRQKPPLRRFPSSSPSALIRCG